MLPCDLYPGVSVVPRCLFHVTFLQVFEVMIDQVFRTSIVPRPLSNKFFRICLQPGPQGHHEVPSAPFPHHLDLLGHTRRKIKAIWERKKTTWRGWNLETQIGWVMTSRLHGGIQRPNRKGQE